jgi:mRNA interferase HigB
MRIITLKRLLLAAARHSALRPKIIFWHSVAKAAKWKNFADARASMRHADQITVKSGRTVTVFNLGDAYRLITAIHYNRERIYVLRVLTHADYDKEGWKDTL